VIARDRVIGKAKASQWIENDKPIIGVPDAPELPKEFLIRVIRLIRGKVVDVRSRRSPDYARSPDLFAASALAYKS